MKKSIKPKCFYRERQANGVMVNSHGSCDHSQEDHFAGTCHHILDIKKDGTVVYCNCVHHKGNHKSFDELGYLEKSSQDWMIPKKCPGCEQVFTLYKDEERCQNCKDIAETEEALFRIALLA